MESNWIDKQVSLYKSHTDNIGQPATYREILHTKFGKDLPAIIALRKLDRTAPDYTTQSRLLKVRLQCFTPAALFETKAKEQVKEISRSGIMQLDFDWCDIKDYDLEELKRCVFNLPFIALCGLSCSGYGFYALALIAEPYRLSEYAELCFEVLKKHSIKPDESKGKKPENLRYISYDANMLIRENPEPLRITHFKAKQALKTKKAYTYQPSQNNNSNALVKQQLSLLQYSTLKELFFEYRTFCDNSGHRPCSNTTFSGRFKSAGYEVKKLSIGRVVYCKKASFNDGNDDNDSKNSHLF